MKHWKQDALIALIVSLVIPLSYLILSPFFAQLVFVPVLIFGLGIFLTHKYGLPLLFLTITSLTYFLFLNLLSLSFDWSYLVPTAGIVWGFGGVGSLIGFFIKQSQVRLPMRLLVIYTIACLLIAAILMFFYAVTDSLSQSINFYVLIPLVCFLTQLLIGASYPVSKWTFLITPLFFLVIHTFMYQFKFPPLVLLYLVVAALGTWLGQKIHHRKS